jgi:hypothetical protein
MEKNMDLEAIYIITQRGVQKGRCGLKKTREV